jgi:hypothetical protein
MAPTWRVTDNINDQNPSWSPDSTAFVSTRSGDWEIRDRADRTADTALTDNTAMEGSPCGRHGTRMTFYSDNDETATSTMNPDGTDVLRSTSSVNDLEAWSLTAPPALRDRP